MYSAISDRLRGPVRGLCANSGPTKRPSAFRRPVRVVRRPGALFQQMGGSWRLLPGWASPMREPRMCHPAGSQRQARIIAGAPAFRRPSAAPSVWIAATILWRLALHDWEREKKGEREDAFHRAKRYHMGRPQNGANCKLMQAASEAAGCALRRKRTGEGGRATERRRRAKV